MGWRSRRPIWSPMKHVGSKHIAQLHQKRREIPDIGILVSLVSVVFRPRRRSVDALTPPTHHLTRCIQYKSVVSFIF